MSESKNHEPHYRFPRVAQIVQRVRRLEYPVEATTIPPIVISIVFALLLDKHRIGQTGALWGVVAAQALPGAWLGVSLRHGGMFGAMLRGVGIGLAIGVGAILTTDPVGPAKNLIILAGSAMMSMWLYCGGYVLGDGVCSICLLSVAEWQRLTSVIGFIRSTLRWLAMRLRLLFGRVCLILCVRSSMAMVRITRSAS